MNDVIRTAIANTKAIFGEHYQTLLGERSTGSKWGHSNEFAWDDGGPNLAKRQAVCEAGLKEKHLLLLVWKEFTPAEGIAEEGCRYFSADISEFFPHAVNAACTIEDLPDDTEIRVVKGRHGWELVADMEPVSTSVATLIIGPESLPVQEEESPDTVDVVQTVHPGEPMKTDNLDGATIKLG